MQKVLDRELKERRAWIGSHNLTNRDFWKFNKTLRGACRSD
jgi:hypothetical protein